MPSLSDISVKLKANIREFKTKMKDAQRSIEGVKNKGQRMGRGMQSAGEAVSAAGAGMAAGLGAAANEAIGFENAMKQVEKVSSAETAAKMEGKIRDMAETIPMAQEKLAAITEDAARFGVEGSKNIENFTRTTAKMANATTLSANQAGESFAKLSKMMGVPISEMENMGSMINELSNNFATSSQEIVDSMMRSASVLSNAGIGEKAMTGMSAALNAVSESSQRAGTRLRRLGQEALTSTGKKVKTLAKAFKDDLGGGSTQEVIAKFKELRKESPQKALLMMAQKMKEGGEEADTLRNALSTVSRQALSQMGGNLDSVRDAMNMANDSFKNATSLQREFEKQSETAQAKVQLLKNKVRDFAITIGNRVLPHLLKLADALGTALDWFDNLSPQVKDTVAKVATFGTVAAMIVGPILFLVGTLATMGIAFSTLVGSVLAVTGVLAGLTAYFTQLSNDGQKAKNAMGTLRQGFDQVRQGAEQARTIFDTQVRPALEKILAAARKAARQFNTHLKPALTEFGGVAIQIIRKVVNRIGELVNKAITLGKRFGVFQTARDILSRVIPVVAQIVTVVSDWLRKHQDLVAEIITFIGVAITVAQTIAGIITVASAASTALLAAAGVVGSLGAVLFALLTPVGLVVGAIALLVAAFATDFMGIRTTTVAVVTAVVGFFKRLRRSAVNLYTRLRAAFAQAVTAVFGFYNGVKRAFNQVVQAAFNLGNRIQAAFSRLVQAGINLYQKYQWVVSLIIGALLTLVTFGLWPLWKNNVLGFRDKVTAALQTVADIFGKVKTWVSDALSAAAQFINKWTTIIQKYVSTLVRQITVKFREIKGKIKKALDEAAAVVNKWVLTIQKFLGTLAQQARQAINKFILAIKQKLAPLARIYNQKIKKPLLDLIGKAKNWGKNLVTTFISGITGFLGKLASKVVKIAQTVEDYIGIYSPAKKGPLSRLHKWGPNLVKTFAQGIVNTISRLVTAGRQLATRFTNRTKAALSAGINTIVTTARTKFNSLRQTAVTAFNETKNEVLQKIAQLRQQALKRFNQLKKQAQRVFAKIRQAVVRAIQQLRQKATALFNKVKSTVVRVVDGLVSRTVQLWTKLKNRVVTTLTTLKTRALALWTSLKDRVVTLATTLQSRAVAIWTTLKNRVVTLATNLKNRAVALVTTLKNRAVALVTNLKNRAVALWTTLKDRAVTLATNLKNRVVDLVTTLKNRAVTLFTNLKDQAITRAQRLKNTVETKITNLKNRALELVDTLKREFVDTMSNLANRARDKAQELYEKVKKKISQIDNISENAKEWGQSIINEFTSGITNKIDDVKDAAGDVASAVDEHMPGSDADTGPLSSLTDYGPDLVSTFARGIEKNAREAGGAAQSVASQVQEGLPSEEDLRIGMPGSGAPITADVAPHGSIPVEGVEPDQEILRVEQGAVQIKPGAFQGVAEEELPEEVRAEVEDKLDQILDRMEGRGR